MGRAVKPPLYPHRQRVESIANSWCSECSFTARGSGALTAGARHARWSNHVVRTTETIVTVYRPRRTRRKGR
jgi:hypothetical protein